MDIKRLHGNIDVLIKKSIELMANPELENQYSLNATKELVMLQSCHHHLKMARSALESFHYNKPQKNG